MYIQTRLTLAIYDHLAESDCPVINYLMFYILDQAMGIGGRGYFWYTPPRRKIFENTPPPWKFWSFPLPDIYIINLQFT